MESAIGVDVWQVVRKHSTPLTGRALNVVCQTFWAQREYRKKDYSWTALALQERDLACYYSLLPEHVNELTWIEACRLGDLKVLESLPSPKAKYTRYFWQEAAKSGHLHVVEWLRSRYGVSTLAFTTAVETENLEMLQFLHESVKEVTSSATEWSYRSHQVTQVAARVGNIEIFKWLAAHDYFPDEICSNIIIKQGHVELMAYLLAEGWPLTEYNLTCIGSANGREILNLLRDRATIPLFKVLCNAVQSGDLDFAEELFSSSSIVNTKELYESAIRGDSMSAIEWLTGKGLSYIPSEQHLRLAVLSRNPEMLEFLRKEGCLWGPNLHTLAVKRNDIPMLHYLLERYPVEYWKSPPLDAKKHHWRNACDVQEILACKKTRRWIRKHCA